MKLKRKIWTTRKRICQRKLLSRVTQGEQYELLSKEQEKNN